jgi:hypothetical protein
MSEPAICCRGVGKVWAALEVQGTEWTASGIAQVVLSGYAYHGRLDRPAFVGVAKGGAEGKPDRPS